MKRVKSQRQRKKAMTAAKNAKPGQGANRSPEQLPPAIQQSLELALQYQNTGRLPEAERIYQQILQADPNQPVALHLLGVIALQVGKHAIAVDLIMKAIALNPEYAEAHCNLGAAHRNLGNLDEAVASFHKALAIMPDYANAHNNLGNTLKDLGQWDKAVASYDKALAIDPDYAIVHYNLGFALKELGRPEDAAAAYQRAVALEPGHTEAHNNLGNVFMDLGRFVEAKAAHDQVLRLNHGGPWWNAATFADGENAAAPPFAELPAASVFKLQDAADQLEYLIGKGRIDPTFERMIERYHAVLEEIQQSEGPEAGTKLTPEHYERLGSFYNRVIYYADAPRIDTGAVNRSLDFGAIEDDYLSSPVSVTAFDDFLTPEALQALRDFCLESTIFFHNVDNHFVVSLITCGFNCGLLYQMAEELKERLPGMLDGHALTNMWAYRYRNQSEGVGTHTDDAAVTFNFWITPDDANLVPGHGGLTVYAKNQPYDWDWLRYNVEKYTPAVKQEIDDFLADAEIITIPYRENRAVLFHSNLFHGSDQVHFKDGFENRRVNVTMVFGKRGAEND